MLVRKKLRMVLRLPGNISIEEGADDDKDNEDRRDYPGKQGDGKIFDLVEIEINWHADTDDPGNLIGLVEKSPRSCRRAQ